MPKFKVVTKKPIQKSNVQLKVERNHKFAIDRVEAKHIYETLFEQENQIKKLEKH